MSERRERIALYYRRRHALGVGSARWDIQAVWQLRGKALPPSPFDRIRFDLDLASLDADWQRAIARARTLNTERATIDGTPARLTLQFVELHFATFENQSEPYGSASFAAVVEEAIPFPRELDDSTFVDALVKAAKLSSGGPIQADEIKTTERYWTFPVHNIGACGVIVDRRNGHPFEISGALDRQSWIWGYEHDLLDEPPRDLVIERVADQDRAFEALRAFARLRREALDTLPLVLERCATWMAIQPLLEAKEAVSWRAVR